MNVKVFLSAVILTTSSAFVLADQVPNVKSDDELNKAKWSLRNGCISTYRIRNVDVLDSKAAILKLTGGKKLLMRFKNDCRNLKHNGFIYTSRTGRLCAKFDSIKVLGQGNTCIIESFEPYIEPDDTQQTVEE